MPISSCKYIIFLSIFLAFLLPINAKAQRIDTKVVVEKDDINVDLSPRYNYNDIPLRIIINDLNIDANVKSSRIVNGTWEVNDEHANFGEGSSYLDEPHGNTIIFAHAREKLFRNLDNVKNGNVINVIGEKGIYSYKIISVYRVLPNEIEKLISYGSENLTLFTCEGFGDEYRLVVKAQKIDNSDLKLEEVI